MTYYAKTSKRIKAHTTVILYLVIGICMIFGTHAANNECSYLGTLEIKELFENIDKNDLISAMPNEDFNRMLELLNESSASKDKELDSEKNIVNTRKFSEAHAANNECDYLDITEIEEFLKDSNKSDLTPVVSNEERNRILELLNEFSASNDIEPNLENHASDTHYQIAPEQKAIIISTFYIDDSGDRFYIDDKGYSICMYLTINTVSEDNISYNVYIDEFGNQIHIDSSICPLAFNIDNLNIEDISSKVCSKQEESIPNNPVKATTLKRPRDSTLTSSGDNLKTKRCKFIKSRDSYLGGAKIFIKSDKYQTACTNLKAYKSEAQSDITRDKPHGFSYLFTKGGMDNENTKCECSVKKNYESQYQFWHFLTSSRHNSLAEKIKCIKSLANEIKAKEVKDITSNSHYYYSFLEDLKNYIENHIDIDHISAKYDYTDSSKNNICCKSKIKSETLGEIYEETQTDLKWWANSMSVIYAKTEELKSAGSADAALKEKLHFILKLPEVLRDLVLITPEILSKIKKEMETSPFSEARKALCIIEYLYYLVNDDAKKANIAYTKVQKLSVNGKHLNVRSAIEIYSFVYNVFCSFYQCAPSTCVMDVKSEEGKAEKKEACIKGIFQSDCPYIPQNGVFRLHGKRAIVKPTLGKYNLNKTTNSTSNGSNSMVIEQQNRLFLNIAYQCSKDHYHVQLVDNTRHTVKLIPIPYSPYCENYIARNRSIQRKTHSIRYIVEYIKSVLKSTYPEKSSDFNVYPFKYNRRIRKWSLIDENFTWHRVKELDKSLNEMNDTKHSVVFYYFEDGLTQNHFRFVDFQTPADPNSETLRIPLFLTNFTMMSTIISPYMFFDKAYIRTEIIKNYATEKKRIKPTKMIIDTAATSQKPSSASPSNNDPQPKRSYINYYYSDFLVQGIDDYRFCRAECFFTDISLNLSEKTGVLSKSWYTQIKRSVREYTNYRFRISATQKLLRESLLRGKKKLPPTFLNLLQNESSTDDKVTYGLCIYTSLSGKEVAVPIMCEKMRSLLSENINDEIKSKHANWESDIFPPRIDIKDIKENSTVFITVKAFNYTQANLGIHYDMLAALFHNKNKPAPVLTPVIKRKPSSKTATKKSSRKTKNKAVGSN
ncbi:hypothetical protein NEAUS06_1005 [Nematocida ausubeli]|nr:hypothetical protein NEAUS06_1005 [Nematocida ausubeli]